MNIDNLSEKELSDLLAKISAEKKRKATAKRKNYQKLRTKFLTSVEKICKGRSGVKGMVEAGIRILL